MIIIYALTILMLSVREYFFMRERQQWNVERQLLLDRIQARDLGEYKALTAPKSEKKEEDPKQEYEFL